LKSFSKTRIGEKKQKKKQKKQETLLGGLRSA